MLDSVDITSFKNDDDSLQTSIVTLSNGIKVLWFGMQKLPSMQVVMNIIVMTLTQTDHKIIIHLEHIGNSDLNFPSLSDLHVLVATLINHKSLMQQKLLGTIFQSKRLDEKTRNMRDIFFSLYTPIRPMIFEDDTSAINQFVKNISIL
jgi:hypothetical protein